MHAKECLITSQKEPHILFLFLMLAFLTHIYETFGTYFKKKKPLGKPWKVWHENDGVHLYAEKTFGDKSIGHEKVA